MLADRQLGLIKVTLLKIEIFLWLLKLIDIFMASVFNVKVVKYLRFQKATSPAFGEWSTNRIVCKSEKGTLVWKMQFP